MNVPTWMAWIFVAILAFISIVIFIGKATFLMAGYNRATKEEKDKYNKKALSKVLGSGLGIITGITALMVHYDAELPLVISWLNPWGVLGTLVLMIILANTICKK